MQRGGVVGVGRVLGLSLQQGDAQVAVQQQLGHLHRARGEQRCRCPRHNIPARDSSLLLPGTALCSLSHHSRPSHSPRAWRGPDRAWQGPRCCEGLEKVSTARNSLPIIRLFRPSPKKLQSLQAQSDSQHRRAAQRHRGVIFTALFIAADITDTPGMEICPCSPSRWGHETVWLATRQPSPMVLAQWGSPGAQGGPVPTSHARILSS